VRMREMQAILSLEVAGEGSVDGGWWWW
jgi:hypothetical protein